MATSNSNDNSGLQRGNDLRAAGPACEAQDLKRILTLLADQIADADRRHSDALQAMQQRLGLLGTTAQDLKTQLPKDMTPVLDRIQGGMAALSEQITETNAQRAQALASFIEVPVHVAPAPEPAPALRSALAADALDAFAKRAQSARDAGQPKVDHFDVVDSEISLRQPRPDQPWDTSAVEALARFYEAPAAHPAAPASIIAASATTTADHPAANPEPAPQQVIAAYTPTADDIVTSAVRAQLPLQQRTFPAAPTLSAAAVMPFANAVLPVEARKHELPPVSTAEFAAEVATLQTKAFADERKWLEHRFADVADRLQSSLKDLSQDSSFASIDARFSQLEKKLSEALNGAGKAADASSLKGIESNVEDLTAQLVSVQNHFSRLDTIELELRSLAERLTSDKLAKLIEQSTGRSQDNEELAGNVASRVLKDMPRIDEALKTLSDSLSTDKLASLISQGKQVAPDAGAIARLVAEHMAQNLALNPILNQAQPAGSDYETAPKIDELRSMLEAFVLEQRHGDEQTNTMLDTMQQAMIRLLDRMDTIEQMKLVEADLRADSARDRTDDEDQHYRRGPASRYDTPPAQYEQNSRRRDAHAGTASQAAIHGMQSAPVVEQPTVARHRHEPQQAPQPVHEAAPRVAAIAGATNLRANVAQPAQDDTPAASATASREDFIASARRAARMTNDAAPESPAETADPAIERAAVAPKVRRSPDSAATGRRPLSRASMALLCLVAVGASFAVVKSTILAPGGSANRPAAPTAKSAPPQSNSSVDKLQQLEDADVIIENDKRGGTTQRSPDGTQRRSSLPGQSGGSVDRDVAGAFDGGPGAAIPAAQLQNHGGFTPAMSEFARQNIPGATAIPTALTKDKAGAAAGKSVDTLPIGIGPNSLRAAALKGDASAEFEVGARFAEGRGVPQDLEQGISWFQKAAAQSFAPAQYRLGSMYERGLGVKTDLARARVWYQRAAEQGIVKAMHNLAVLSAGRDASSTDYESASKWFKTAADHGLTDSQFNLAIMHDSGLGMPRDAKLAYKWFSLAARSGDEEAARRRETLRQKLTPQEASEVDGELASWRPKSADQAANDGRMAGEAWKQRSR